MLKKFVFAIMFMVLATPCMARSKKKDKTPTPPPTEQPAVADDTSQDGMDLPGEEAVVEELRPETFTSEQIMLNNRAVDATNKGNFKDAELYYKAMLKMAEFDAIWANIGSTYSRQGRCIEARRALQKAETSPSVVEIPHEFVMTKVAEYSAEIEEKCTAPVVLHCITPNMTITIDGGDEFECNSDTLYLTPGAHSIYASTSFGFSNIRTEAKNESIVTVPIEVINYEELAANGGLTPEEKAKRSMIFKTVGWTLFGLGAGVAAGGGAVMGVSYNEYVDAHDAQKTDPQAHPYNTVAEKKKDTEKKLKIAYSLLGVGGAVLATGIALLIVDAVKYDSPSNSTVTSTIDSHNFIMAPYVSSDGGGMGISFEF